MVVVVVSVKNACLTYRARLR